MIKILYITLKVFFTYLIFISGEIKPGQKTIVICHYRLDANTRPDYCKLPASSIPLDKCDRIVAENLILNEDNSEIALLRNEDAGVFDELSKLKTDVYVQVGSDQDSNSDKWKNMFADEGKSNTFINSLMNFVAKYKLKGIEMAYQFPYCRMGNFKEGGIEEKDLYQVFMERLKKACETNKLQLMVLIPRDPQCIDEGFDIKRMADTADLLEAYTTDFYGDWSGRAYKMQTLYSENENDNIHDIVTYIISKQINPSKIAFTVALYARAYEAYDGFKIYLYDKIEGPAQAGPVTNTEGFLAFFEICRIAYTRAVHEHLITTYNDVGEVTEMAKYALLNKFGGVALRSIDWDDVSGQACLCDVQFPLLTAVSNVLHGNPVTPCDIINCVYSFSVHKI